MISDLFYEELFSDSGLLSLDDTDRILEDLMLFYFERYQISYGIIKTTAWEINCTISIEDQDKHILY